MILKGRASNPMRYWEKKNEQDKLDNQAIQQHEGAEHNQPDSTEQNVHAALDRQFPALQQDVADRHQRQPAQIADRHFARHDLKDVRRRGMPTFSRSHRLMMLTSSWELLSGKPMMTTHPRHSDR